MATRRASSRKPRTDRDQANLFESPAPPANAEHESAGEPVYLIDANSLLHRAFHALPENLVNSKGRPVNATFGFASMLVKLINDYHPSTIIAAFDTKAPTFRHGKFVEYKANRPETAELLVQQFPDAHEILEAFGIPIVEIEGYEADDILATLARKAREQGRRVYIVSGDRDMLQLVNDHVTVLSTKKGISEIKEYDRAAVIERFGVEPEKIPDFLALKGEPGDNIPGLPGIGEKTAAAMIQQFGSLEGVYENIDTFKGKKTYDTLVEYRDQAFLARELATLAQDAPVDESLLDVRFDPDLERVARVLTEYEFGSLLDRLGVPRVAERIPRFRVEAPVSEVPLATLESAVTRDRWLGILTTDGGMIAAGADGYAPLPADAARSLLSRLVEGEGLLVTNSIKEVAHACGGCDELATLVARTRAFDLSLMLWLLDPDGKNYNPDSYESGAAHAFEAGKALLEWAQALAASLEKENMSKLYFDLEAPIALTLYRMEEFGLFVDLQSLEALARRLEAEIEQEAAAVYSLTGYEFNLNSPQQLAYILFDKLKLAPGKKKKQHYSTDAATLTRLANSHPAIPHLLRYRELTKMKSSFVDVFLARAREGNGRLRTRFVQTGTATGRLSSEDPNLQNIPLKGDFSDELRRTIHGGPGRTLISADYAQVDLRMLAHISREPRLIQAFSEGRDIHTATAAEVFGVSEEDVTKELRRIAKIINFAIIYGVSVKGLAEQAGISVATAERYMNLYFERYPNARLYMDTVIKEAYEKGYVTTILGRRRYLPGLQSSNVSERNASERLALNSPIQGSAADVIKLAMLKFEREAEKSGLDARLVLQIHDSLVVSVAERDVEKAVRVLEDAMRGAYPLLVPLDVKVSVGDTLADV